LIEFICCLAIPLSSAGNVEIVASITISFKTSYSADEEANAVLVFD